eukprot:3215227-Rhodomonas_salina.1
MEVSTRGSQALQQVWPPLPACALATRCPVLTWQMILSAYALAMRYLGAGVWQGGLELGAHVGGKLSAYAMSGTDYATYTTRCPSTVRTSTAQRTGKPPLSAYAPATRCPVLTYARWAEGMEMARETVLAPEYWYWLVLCCYCYWGTVVLWFSDMLISGMGYQIAEETEEVAMTLMYGGTQVCYATSYAISYVMPYAISHVMSYAISYRMSYAALSAMPSALYPTEPSMFFPTRPSILCYTYIMLYPVL